MQNGVDLTHIRDIKSTLTQRALQFFFETYHIPDEVHPQLPNPNRTIHEMPTDKIGVYTRFFDTAKVSHFEVLCHVHGFEPTVGLFRCFYVNSKNKGWVSFSKRPGNDAICYTKPLDSLKNWNDRFFWVDSFACPASFPWSTSKGVPKDPFPKSSEFNTEHYAILVAHPAPFHKYPKPFLCLVGISHYYTLDVDTYPEFLRDGDEGLERDSVGRVVPLLPVAPARTSGELEASVEKLFGERDGGEQVEQGDSAGGGHGVDIQSVIAAADTIVEDVAPLQPMHRKIRKTVVVDATRPFHPPKKLREDYGDPSGPFVVGKPRFAVQRLLAGVVLNAEVRGEPISALPFVTSSVSATPEREGEDHIDSVTGLNLWTISAPQRFVISSDSSYHSGANIAEAEVDSFARPFVPIITAATTVTLTSGPAVVIQEKTVKPSVFAAYSSSAGGDPNACVFSDLSGSDFLVSGIRTVIDHEFDLQKLFTEFNVGAARQVSLSAEVRMRAEYNIKEKRKLKTVEAKAAEAIRLRAEVSGFAAMEKSLRDEVNALNGRNLILEKERDALDVKNDNLANQVHELETSSAGLQEKVTTYENCMEQLKKF
ncbi:hypothetical protein Tco_0443342 [Tanacetum coccineum]